jgi:hypothetical protein
MKTGVGFYEWTPDEAAATRSRLTEHLMAALAAKPADGPTGGQ